MDQLLILRGIFEKQKNFQHRLGIAQHYLSRDVMYHDLLVNLNRAQGELEEAIREVPHTFGNYSKTKSETPIDREAYLSECVDSFLFLVNSMNILGINAAEFLDTAVAIQNRNVDRLDKKLRFVPKRECPLIIIEGADGVGKTTIIERLCQVYSMRSLRMPRPDDDPSPDRIERDSKLFNMMVDQIKEPLILDRGYPSSIVYSQVFNRDIDINYIKDLYSDREVFVFVIDCDKPKRTDDWYDEDDFYKIRDCYRKLANQHQWVIINNDGFIDYSVDQIIRELQF